VSARPARVLVVHRGGASFARRDARILAGPEVEVRLVDVRRPAAILSSARDAWTADALLSWFVSVHTVVPMLVARLRGRPVVLIPGGYEVADEPQIPYGWRGSWWRRRAVAVLLRGARRVLAVSPCIAESIEATAPGVHPALVPNAIEEPADVAVPSARRRYDVATSIVSVDEPTRRRKGIDLFVAAAERMPDRRFLVVGDLDWPALPANVTVTGRLDPDGAERALGDARVYVQASRGYEAFGSALLEAMARGATPVVTDVGGMPWVVGDAGYVVPADDVDALAAGIDTALQNPRTELSAHRAVTEFSTTRRRAGLEEALELVR
jgi:glycosyltransferase involved in cell wall biosynthesis